MSTLFPYTCVIHSDVSVIKHLHRLWWARHKRRGEGTFTYVVVDTPTSYLFVQPREGPQTCDQTWENTRNASLRVSAHNKKPVRVVRGYSSRSDFAPIRGYRYDGLYVVDQVRLCSTVCELLKIRTSPLGMDGRREAWLQNLQIHPYGTSFPLNLHYKTFLTMRV